MNEWGSALGSKRPLQQAFPRGHFSRPCKNQVYHICLVFLFRMYYVCDAQKLVQIVNLTVITSQARGYSANRCWAIYQTCESPGTAGKIVPRASWSGLSHQSKRRSKAMDRMVSSKKTDVDIFPVLYSSARIYGLSTHRVR